jgi:hypothetical protein
MSFICSGILIDGIHSGTPATASQMAKDVVSFLSWAAEPEHDERKKMGMQAMIILSTLTMLSLYLKRHKWSSIKNRKLREWLLPLALSDQLTLIGQQSILLRNRHFSLW